MLFRPSEHQTASLCDVRRQIIFSTKWAEVSWAVPLGRRNWKEFKLIESVKFILIRTISTFNSVIWSPYIDLEMKKKRRICLVTMSAKTNLAKILESDIWCSYQYNIMTIIWTNIIQHYIISVIYSILSCFTWTRSWTSRCTPRWPPWLSCPPPPSSPSPSSAWRERDPRSSRKWGSRDWTSPGWRCTSHCQWSPAPCSPRSPPGLARLRLQESPRRDRGRRSWDERF